LWIKQIISNLSICSKRPLNFFKVNVAAYCLMPNHYHLMLQTPDANLSRCMRHLNGVYMRVKVKLRADRKFKDCLEHIENNILKSQT